MEAGLAVMTANIHIALLVNNEWSDSLAVAYLSDT
jgi:hypothetical protein